MKKEIAMSFDQDKFDALVLYICNRCHDRRDVLGKTKLNKVLWNSDKYHYAATGRSITGATYIKLQFGPVPKGIDAAIERLRKRNHLHVDRGDFFGHQKYEFFPLVPSDEKQFSSDELRIINMMIQYICFEKTAQQASDESHTKAWEIAENGEEIPLFTVFMEEPGEIDEADLEWAKDVLGLKSVGVA